MSLGYAVAPNVDDDLKPLEIQPCDEIPYMQLELHAATHTDTEYPQPELKYFDTDILGNSPPVATQPPVQILNFAPFVVCINQIAQGTQTGQRVSNQITCKSLSYHLVVNTAGNAQQFCRLSFVWDRQPNGGPVPAEPSIYSSLVAFAFPNINTRDRYVILRTIELPLVESGNDNNYISGRIPLDMVSTYVGSAGNVPATGALLILWNGYTAVTGPAGNLNGQFRLRYYDN